MALDLTNASRAVPRSAGSAELSRDWGRLCRLHQQGCLKILIPHGGTEAVVVNTAGGMTGGDKLALNIHAGAGEALTLTTQAAERVYRSAGGAAQVSTVLTLGQGARIDWLPQETILFEGSALDRRLSVEMAADATLLAVESLVFGRIAHGETLRQLQLRDHWRIRRGGRLVHAEALRLERMPTSPATLAGATAAATMILAAPGAEQGLDAARAALPEGAEAGVSALPGLLVARFLAPSSQALRAALVPLIRHFRAGPPPRLWQL
ncbi:urease accessory protein UreD [Paracoccus binzhouensis]|uniref:urease accessory protein UreD n=1 Tax=Paracoccus binzhouensis TaxID=2796149 RepID=UPI0018EF1588|nr:urease accessory protein UreD [Paracoccus binzhouensis]